jgi:hypothetical protein
VDLTETRRRAAYALADILPPPRGRESNEWERHPLSASEFPVPELILFAMTRLRDLESFGPGEKLRWGVSATFRGTSFSITLEKFGLRLYVPESTSSEVRLALIRCLRTATNLAEACLREVAQYQTGTGNATIENRYHHFERAYRFFREKAREAYDAPPPEPVVMSRDQNGRPTGWSSEPWKPQIEGGYMAGAMLDAYFSWLEHALVLVLPFIDFEPADGALVRFVGATWDGKWRTIFDLTADQGAKQVYDDLRRIKETVRNPIAHGGFGKKGTSFFFHVEGIGALPALLTRHGRSFEFIITRVPHATYQQLCQQLDVCDAFLQGSKLRAGLRYAQAGLDVALSEGFRGQCREASRSEEELGEFIEHQSYLADMHTNMDY